MDQGLPVLSPSLSLHELTLLIEEKFCSHFDTQHLASTLTAPCCLDTNSGA